MIRQQKQIQEYLAEKEKIKRQSQIQYQFMDPDQLMNQEDKDKLESGRQRIENDQNSRMSGLKVKYRESQLKDIQNDQKFSMALRNSVFRGVHDFDVGDEQSVAKSNDSQKKVKNRKKTNQTATISSKGSSQQNTMYDV